MTFEIVKRIEQPSHTSIYKLFIKYVNGKDLKVYTIDKSLLELLITTYSTYKRNLSNNWNKFCNINLEDINDVLQESHEKLQSDVDIADEDFISDYWNNCDNGWFYAIPDSWEVSYYDENGIEYVVKVIK